MNINGHIQIFPLVPSKMVSMSVTINNQKVLQTLHFQKVTKDDSKKLTN